MRTPNAVPPPRMIFDTVGWLNFALLCLIQGSTFLAMRLAVGPGGGFTPFVMAATRFTAAGAALLALLAAAGFAVRLSARQLAAVLSSGVLLCGGGTGLATLASRSAGSGLVAIFFALGPIWVTAMESVMARRRPPALGLVAMTMGVAGVGLLVMPSAKALPGDAMTLAALLLGPFCYAAGSVVLKHTVLKDGPGGQVSIWVAIAWQMIGGSAALWVAVLAAGEPLPTPTSAAWMAWAYSTLVSSLVAFGAYMTALRRLPTPVFMSHSWVFPVVANVLGWVVLGEALPGGAYAAGGLILCGLIVLVASAARATRGGTSPTLAGAISEGPKPVSRRSPGETTSPTR